VAGGFSIDADRDASEEVFAAQRDAIRAFMANNDAEVLRWFDHARREPDEWYDNAIFRRAHITLTVTELKELLEAVDKLLEPYLRAARPVPPAGARLVSMVYRALPMEAPERGLPPKM
jgi:hypothetical protein